MHGVIDADTHISEGEAMWAMMDKAMQPRRPIMLSVPEDTWYGNRNAFWLIDGEIYPKPAGKGSFALVTPSAQKVQEGRKDSTPATREMTDIIGRLADMDKLHTAAQVVYPTLFLVYNTKERKLELALCRAYNRFLAKACAQASERIRWVAVLPLQTMSAALDEIHYAKENGAVGIFFRGIEGEYTLDNPYLFPVYEEAQRRNLSICVHTGCGVRDRPRIPDSSTASRRAAPSRVASPGSQCPPNWNHSRALACSVSSARLRSADSTIFSGRSTVHCRGATSRMLAVPMKSATKREAGCS